MLPARGDKVADRNSDVNKDDMFPARAEQGMIARSESKKHTRSPLTRVIPPPTRVIPPPTRVRNEIA